MSVLAALLKLPIGKKYKYIILNVNRCEILINIVAIISIRSKSKLLASLQDKGGSTF